VFCRSLEANHRQLNELRKSEESMVSSYKSNTGPLIAWDISNVFGVVFFPYNYYYSEHCG